MHLLVGQEQSINLTLGGVQSVQQYSHAGHYLEAQLNSTIDMKSDIEAIHLSVSQDLAIFDQETSSSIRAQVQAFTNANGFYYYET